MLGFKSTVHTKTSRALYHILEEEMILKGIHPDKPKQFIEDKSTKKLTKFHSRPI